MAVADRKLRNAGLSVGDAQSFLDITEKQEKGGEVAHSDTVKAHLQLIDRRRDQQEAQLALDKARIGFAVLLFPDYQTEFHRGGRSRHPRRAAGLSRDPDARRQEQSRYPRRRRPPWTEQNFELRSAKGATGCRPCLRSIISSASAPTSSPSITRAGDNLLGSVAQVQLTVPIWTWGAARSKVKQAEFKLQQAKNDLTYTQRNLLCRAGRVLSRSGLARATGLAARIGESGRSRACTSPPCATRRARSRCWKWWTRRPRARDARNALDDGLARYRVPSGICKHSRGRFRQ